MMVHAATSAPWTGLKEPNQNLTPLALAGIKIVFSCLLQEIEKGKHICNAHLCIRKMCIREHLLYEVMGH